MITIKNAGGKIGRHWKLSGITKKRISEARTGMKFSEEHKRKMSEVRKGKPSGTLGKHWKIKDTSNMNKDKIGKESHWKGRKRPEMTGENSPVWVFGNYKKQGERNDSAYQDWVKKVRKRDKNQCALKGQNCSGYCIVHHILPWSEYPDLRYNIKNGITLCQFHHPRKRDEEKRLIPFFQEMVGSKERI